MQGSNNKLNDEDEEKGTETSRSPQPALASTPKKTKSPSPLSNSLPPRPQSPPSLDLKQPKQPPLLLRRPSPPQLPSDQCSSISHSSSDSDSEEEEEKTPGEKHPIPRENACKNLGVREGEPDSPELDRETCPHANQHLVTTSTKGGETCSTDLPPKRDSGVGGNTQLEARQRFEDMLRKKTKDLKGYYRHFFEQIFKDACIPKDRLQAFYFSLRVTLCAQAFHAAHKNTLSKKHTP